MLLNDESTPVLELLSLFLSVLFKHESLNHRACIFLPDFFVGEEQELLVRKGQHIIEILLKSMPSYPTPYHLLNLDDLKHLILHLLENTVPLPVPPVHGLDHD